MLIQIFGSGAIGSLFGYFMCKAGYDVIFVARGERFKALSRGLEISGIIEDCIDVKVVKRACKSDISFVTVKSYDTLEAARQLAGKTEIAFTIQNGIGNEEILSSMIDKVAGGTTSYAANIRNNTVVYAGEGITYVGEWKGEGFGSLIANILKKSNMNVEVVSKSEIRRKKWEKAAINAVINPITAVLKVKNGELLNGVVWGIALELCKECQKVLESMGINMDVANAVRNVAKKTSENISSMLQDIEKGKITEIDAITGKFIDVGELNGIDVRLNKVFYNLVKYISKDW